MFLNFSYGSNMLSKRIRARAPSARAVATGVLRGHELRWHKAGADGSAKCDVVPVDDPGAQVLGVVYQVAAGEKHLLDQAEGLGVEYAQKQVLIDTDAGAVSAWVYQALKIDPSLAPYTWYKALVLAGAREHRLANQYQRQLEAVAACADDDLERAARHFALIDAPQPRNPLHGKTLQMILEALVAAYGWTDLAQRIPLRCFSHDPSVASSLKFLRKTPWAREKVESLYLFMLRDARRAGAAGAPAP